MIRENLVDVTMDLLALCGSPAQKGARIVLRKRAPAADPKNPKPKDGDCSMDPKELEAKLAKAESDKAEAEVAKAASDKRAERAEKVAALKSEERAIFDALPIEKQDGFLALDAAGRGREVAKAKDADPIIYTSTTTGRSFRKSAPAELVEMAKSNDELADKVAKSEAAREEQILKSAAATRFTKTSFTPDERLELCRMLNGGVCKNEAIRKSIGEKLDAIDKDLAKAFASAGVADGGEPEPSSPAGQFTAMLKSRMAAKGEDADTATAALLGTPEGRAAYNAMAKSKRNREMGVAAD